MGGWGCPISDNMFLRYTASFALMNRAPSSASAAEDGGKKMLLKKEEEDGFEEMCAILEQIKDRVSVLYFREF